MDVLLTFTGFHDPYAVGLVGEVEQRGPILSLVQEKSFDQIVLFSTPGTQQNTLRTTEALRSLFPAVSVDVRDIPLDDPTDYITILRGLRTHLRELTDQYPKARYFIAVASGTPQMHACWVLLAASGEIPAHVLHIRPHRFVSKDRPVVSEIDLSSSDFPVVRVNIGGADVLDAGPPDVGIALQQLKIVGDHPTIQRAVEIAAVLAQSAVPILILGETGTGKELFARLIHRLSGRLNDRFVPLNCAAIPKELVESILFGHKRGAFTGAINDQKGKFAVADGGTLFLDELAELPLVAQAKLLRVLQDGIIEPLGDTKPHRVDVRVIAATNQDVKTEIREGRFRDDLYYRLNVGEIRLPPLRERRSDIPKLALYVLDRVNSTLKTPKRLTPDALTRLQNYPWPGNVRDLANVIERSVRLTRRDVLDADDLLMGEPMSSSDSLVALPDPHEGFSLEEYLTSTRKQLILHALETAKGNQSEAARLLGITPQAVHKFVQKLDAAFNKG